MPEAAGRYDIVGDVHGCLDELLSLLERLGYRWNGQDLTPPQGRTLVFVGDLVDRGPKVAEVVTLVRRGVETGVALSVRGNHDDRLARALAGEAVKPSRLLDTSLAQLERLPAADVAVIRDFLAALPARLELDGGRLLVVHAGERADLSGDARAEFNVNGATTGRVTEDGLKERFDWVTPYTGAALVVYGHTPVLRAEQVGQTLDLDTGCVFGGQLTTLRYPEMELVSVPSLGAYATNRHWQLLTQRVGAGA